VKSVLSGPKRVQDVGDAIIPHSFDAFSTSFIAFQLAVLFHLWTY
jgi:hypothetical protein